jgi:two-component system, OmpR family, response regulator
VRRVASRVLVVDGEADIRSRIGRALAAAGYVTGSASTGTEGLRQALESRYDLVILDLMMPDLDGRDVLERLLSARPYQAVMVLSSLADVTVRVHCLERGARDYMTKPFSVAELLARIRLRLGELGENAHPRGEVIEAGQLILDVGQLAADIGNGLVPLTRLEFLLLKLLAEHAGQPVPKDKLLATIWGYDFDPGSNIVDACVRRVRSKLGFDLIKTVRRGGYRLNLKSSGNS